MLDKIKYTYLYFNHGTKLKTFQQQQHGSHVNLFISFVFIVESVLFLRDTIFLWSTYFIFHILD